MDSHINWTSVLVLGELLKIILFSTNSLEISFDVSTILHQQVHDLRASTPTSSLESSTVFATLCVNISAVL